VAIDLTIRQLKILPSEAKVFENLLSAYCDLVYADVSLVEMITDSEVVALIKKAEDSFRAGDRSSAMLHLKFAFHKIAHPEGKYLPLLTAPEAPTISSELRATGFAPYFKQLHSFLNESSQTANANLLKIDRGLYVAFQKSSPFIRWSMTGTAIAQSSTDHRGLSGEEFHAWREFIIDYAFKAQAAYLDYPSGWPTAATQREYYLRVAPRQ
jgi:hypothetical protein